MSPRVTLHAWRVPARRLPRVLWHVARDPRRLRREPGVRFVKLLGTGRDGTFAAGTADPTRWVAITVTDARAAPAFPAWDRIAAQACRVDLRPLSSRGRWAGVEPFPTRDTMPATLPGGGPVSTPGNGPEAAVGDGPVLALTRARLRPGRALAFWRAIGAAAPGPATPGLVAAFGIGEAPIGWQGTVSVWRTQADLAAFAYRHPGHRRAVDRTPIVGWYAEELFARFAVLDVAGDAAVLGGNPI